MSDMRELFPQLDMIDIKHTSLIPAEKPKRVNPAPIRRKRNTAITGIDITAAVSKAINEIQSIIIYILKPGVF